MAPDMNPEEIRKLPVNRNLPYNGLTREQVIALGADPDEVEAGRLAHNEWATQQRRSEDVQLALAAQEAVAEGNATYAEAAQALLAAGRREAHDAVVQMWREEEAFYMPSEADEVGVMDAEQYVEYSNAQQLRERERLAQEAEEAARQLKVAQVAELQKDFKSIVESTPGAHQFAPGAERQLVADLQESGILPSTPEERVAVIETSLRKNAILGTAEEAIKQQIDQEIRIMRKPGGSGMRDGLQTQGDIDRANAIYREQRFKQLADSTMVDLEAFRPAPTAEEQSAALVEKYREKQEASTALHQSVSEIAARGKDANATRDRGEGMSAERAAYKAAYAKAEAEAVYGEVKTAAAASEESPKPGGYGPDGTWPDELGAAI
jgi:hypothetical protein